MVVSSEAFGGLLVFTLRKGRNTSSYLAHSGFIQQVSQSLQRGKRKPAAKKQAAGARGKKFGLTWSVLLLLTKARAQTSSCLLPPIQTGNRGGRLSGENLPSAALHQDPDICFPQKVQSWGQELPLPLSLPLLDPASICACQSVVKPGTTEESSRPSVKPSSNSNTSGISTQPFIIVVGAPVSPTRSL